MEKIFQIYYWKLELYLNLICKRKDLNPEKKFLLS